MTRRFVTPDRAVAAGIVALCIAASASAANIANGSRLYSEHCVACHGANGKPTMPGAPDLRRGTIMMRPDAQLMRSVKSGRGAMPAFFGILNEREMLDVVAYMRTLQ
jgi:cytochrome c6